MAKKNTATSTKPESSIEQKRDYAKLLYVVQGVTNQKELSARVGVSVQSINKWINADNELWRRLRESFLVTKESELRRLYMQITELNDLIMGRASGSRFANSKEADILVKLTAAVKQLETDTSIADIMEAHKSLINFVRQTDFEMAKSITALCDQHLKSLIK